MAGGVTDRKTAVFFFLLAAAMAGTVAWLTLGKGGAEPGPAPGPPVNIIVPGQTPSGGNPPGKGHPGKSVSPKKAPAPIPEEPGFAATRESCLEFLRRQAGPPAPPSGQGPVALYPEVRLAALEALQSLDPAAVEPLLMAVLGGDGDPEDWSEERLGAAALRVRAGNPDGAATVRGYLKADRESPFWTEGALPAARAASWMAPAEGAAVLSSLLTAPLDEYDEDAQATMFGAVAVLGAGSPAEDLRAMLKAGKDTWEPQVLGAVAGALKRLGDDAGKTLLDALAADRWTGGEDMARGLGARGNAAVLPWLASLLTCEDSSARAAAARAMAEVGDRSAIPALQAALRDEDAWVRDEAAVSLLVLGDAASLPAARAASSSRDSEVQVLAWKALAQAGDPGSKDAAAALLASSLPGPRDGRRGNALHPRVWAARLWLGTEK